MLQNHDTRSYTRSTYLVSWVSRCVSVTALSDHLVFNDPSLRVPMDKAQAPDRTRTWSLTSVSLAVLAAAGLAFVFCKSATPVQHWNQQHALVERRAPRSALAFDHLSAGFVPSLDRRQDSCAQAFGPDSYNQICQPDDLTDTLCCKPKSPKAVPNWPLTMPQRRS